MMRFSQNCICAFPMYALPAQLLIVKITATYHLNTCLAEVVNAFLDIQVSTITWYLSITSDILCIVLYP